MTKKRVFVALLVLALGATTAAGGLGFARACRRAQRAAEESACMRNLHEVYAALLDYRREHSRCPPFAGVRFFAEAFVGRDPGDPSYLTCPEGAVRDLPDRWWTLGAALDGTYSAFAGRDPVAHPLRGWSPEEALAACDNAAGMNHVDVTHVLLADGSIRSLSLGEEKARGTVPRDATRLVVGPDSPLETLRKLSLD